MRKLMSTLFVIMAAASVAMAADKPDFTGDWKMDADKSSFGQMPPPASILAKIDHKDPALSITTTQNDQTQTFKYSTDGKETTNSMMGNEMKSKAVWEGKTLVIASVANMGGVDLKVDSKYSLSDDGKTLTQALKIAAPQGEFEMSIVLVKQ